MTEAARRRWESSLDGGLARRGRRNRARSAWQAGHVDEEWQERDKWRTPPMHLRWIAVAIFVAAIIRYLTM